MVSKAINRTLMRSMRIRTQTQPSGRQNWRSTHWLMLGLTTTATLFLVACGAVVPGNDVYKTRITGESSIPLPVETPQGEVPAHIRVQRITTDFIIEQTKALRQQPPPAPTPTPTPTPAVHYDYRLGPADVINIIVWDHPELTMPAGEFRTAEQSGTVISEDGTIYFPFVGVIKVSGLTTGQLRDILTKKLSATIENVQLEVRVAAFRSQRIYVVGEVDSPGIIPITDVPMTMIEAVNRAGGFSDSADRSAVTLTRGNSTRIIDLLALYDEGDLSQNVLLQDGDIVKVRDDNFKKIFVLGAVRRNGSLQMQRHKMSLAEVLSDAGNIDQFTANPYQIYVYRGGDRPEIYHLASKSPDGMLLAERFEMKPRDVVYVDAADIVRWNRVISLLLPTSNYLQNLQNLDVNQGLSSGSGSN